MKRWVSVFLAGGLAVSQFGCTTEKLWDDTNSEYKVWINADEITEAELKQRGVPYSKYSTKSRDGFLVGKSDREKFKNYTYRVLGTPVTLVADAVTTTAGVVVICAVLSLSMDGGNWMNEVCN